jgi:hypothetical protein
VVEIVSIVVLGVVVLALLWLLREQRIRDMEVIAALTEKVMARSYAEYVQGQIVREDAVRPMTAEEIYDAQTEQGIPM